ncbi:hypothetical protein GCM10022245_08810 [Streptomyces mayteni]
MPVGKAIALAAMPSAALMGMGFTSPLAKADPSQPENPFQDAPCVEMPDEADAEAEAEAEDSAEEPTEEPSEEPTDEETPEPEPDEDAEPDAQPTDEAMESDAARDPAEDAAATEREPAEGQDAAQEPAEQTEEPAAEEPNPWDPLGVGRGLEELGNAIGDVLNPGRGEEPPAEPEDPADEPEGDPADEPEPTAPPAEQDESDRSDGTDEASADEGEAEDAAREPDAVETDEAEAEADEPDDGEDDAEERDEVEVETVDPFAPDDLGRLPFPCPEERRVPGTDERTPLVLPDQPWYLDATYLTLRGLDYHGVVNVTTANGSVKQVLKFTADLIDIGDLHQIVDAPGGVRYHVGTDPGSNSTFRNGTVTMYTERLEGNLFGIIPVVFDPEHEPPLDLPIAHFTDVLVTQAGQFGGELTMQGMTNFTTNDGPTTVG